MKVHVRFFSLTRERAGRAGLDLELAAPANVKDALGALSQRFPGLGDLLDPSKGLCLIAVNREYAATDAPLQEGDEMALFPPVSGGSGPGGQKALVLLSGGFDSPVAAHAVLAQGLDVEAVHFSLEPFTDDASSRKAADLCRILNIPRLTVVTIGPELGHIARTCEPGAYFVLQKRLMIRLGEAVAAQSGATWLITGENLGQVSSQTLPNLGAIDQVSTVPVLRPLLGLDKVEIIRQAERIGTFETSKGPEICDILGPRHPNIAVTSEEVQREERKLDVGGLVQAALGRARVIETAAAREA